MSNPDDRHTQIQRKKTISLEVRGCMRLLARRPTTGSILSRPPTWDIQHNVITVSQIYLILSDGCPKERYPSKLLLDVCKADLTRIHDLCVITLGPLLIRRGLIAQEKEVG
jgi:hypothetical protein